MSNLMLHLGNDNYVNLDKVKLISSASAEKVRKYRTDRKIDKDSINFFNGSSVSVGICVTVNDYSIVIFYLFKYLFKHILSSE